MKQLPKHLTPAQIKRRKAKRQKKIIRNIFCILFCILLLLITICGIHILSKVINENYTLSSAIKELGEKLTSDNTESSDNNSDNNTDDNQFVVCIDAGHGGKDNGSDYNNKRFEKDDNLKIALKVQSYLETQNVKVIMTRTDDSFLKLSKRCSIANKANADYMVSLHRNTGDGTGVETWAYSAANQETLDLAGNILNALDDIGVQRNRGIKQGTEGNSSKDYYINSHSDMPSCIVELGFLTNTKDNELFDKNIDAYAKAIGDAIITTHDNKDSDSVSATESSAMDTAKQVDTEAETETTVTSSSQTLTNTPIADITSLSNAELDWGQGTNVDDENRPLSALSYQETYSKYNANFIGDKDHTIYLTFDEGYECGFTPSILDTLKEKNVHVVFFVTEPYAKTDPELVQRMIDEGHAVGNHSVTHPAAGLPSETIEQQEAEVNGNHKYIKDNFGYEMHLFRYPAGKFSEQSLAIVNNCNYKSVFWSFAYVDYDVNNQPDESESLTKLISKLHSGAIYLLHAESQTNTNILASFIDQARAAGYKFELFD